MKLILILWSTLEAIFSYNFAYCNTIYVSGISNTDQNSILSKHNDYRVMVANANVTGQPRGINLKKLKYDTALAQAAQNIADTTIFAHVKVNDSRWTVGQNLYMSMSTGNSSTPNWPAALQAWFNEYTSYNYSTCCSGGAGHYTQVVWADTNYVGCGFTYFENVNSTYKYQKLYVCNYGPAGNWVGEYPYETGASGCETLC